MSRGRFNLKLKLNVYILSAATIIYCMTVGYISYRLNEITYNNSVEIVKGSTREYQNKISEKLNVIMESARTMRDVFSTHKKYEPAQRDTFFEAILYNSVEKNPDYLSVGLYWEIKAFNEKYNKKNGRIRNICYRLNNKISFLHETVDTTNAKLENIYYTARSLNKEMIWDPYFDVKTKELAGILMTTLFVPIQNASGQFEGAVGIDIALNDFNRLISGIKPFKESVSYIVGGSKVIVAHSDQTLTGKNFLSSIKSDSLVFKTGIEQMKTNTASTFTYINSDNNEEYFVSLVPISIQGISTNWIIGVEVPTKVILSETRKVMIRTTITGLLGLFLLYIVIYLIAVKISDPIIKGVEFARSISEGNLNAQLEIQQNDEIGDLAESLSIMASRLTKTISEVMQSSDAIAESSINLLNSSVRLADGANNQAASSEEISTSMELVLSRIQQNTQNAQETEKIAILAAQGIQVGNESTKDLIQSMNNIVQKVSIIGEIAKQTNLLAINAAIEASRFGIQGKGFAVVAAEIKKLAEKSQFAAKEINELSNKGLFQAKVTGDILLDIIPDIEHTAILVKQIASASLEQITSSEEINAGIQQLNRVTQQNAGSAFELSVNSRNISQQADNLKKLVAYFKIEGLN